MRSHKILIMGLPGAGKTTLSRLVAARLNAVHLNADEVRSHVNKDLGFSESDRIEQARRMGWLCDQVTRTGSYAIADFVCPTPETRAAFLAGGGAVIVWVDRIESSRFDDTNRLFVPPDRFDIRIPREGSPEYWSERIVSSVEPVFDPSRPTALFVGRYQPFHDGHKALVIEGIRRVGQACIAVRTANRLDGKNPFAFEEVKSRIGHALREFEGRFAVVSLPNITNIFYGRDVGYSIARIDLDRSLEQISATRIRATIGPAASIPSLIDA